MATYFRMCSPSRQDSWLRPARRARRVSLSRTGPRTGGSRSTLAAAGSFPNLNELGMRYATTSSRAVPRDRPRSRGRRRPGSLTGAEDAPTDRLRATEALEGTERFSEQRRLLPLCQALDQPRSLRQRRTVDPLVRTLRPAGRHHNVASLAPHVEPRAEQARAVADLRLPRIAEEDVDAASPGMCPGRLRNRNAHTLDLP